MNLRDMARIGVINLEEGTGLPLRDVPVGTRDQYCAMVRDTFKSMDVDLGEKEQANAAFIGAHVAMSTMMTQGPASLMSMSHLLRYLMDRADGGETKVSRWTRLKIRLANWLTS
jgi:hypothetical protein